MHLNILIFKIINRIKNNKRFNISTYYVAFAIGLHATAIDAVIQMTSITFLTKKTSVCVNYLDDISVINC